VVYIREEVEGLPRTTDELTHIPEVLVLDANHSPIVQSELIFSKSFIFGGKLKYFPWATVIYFSAPKQVRTTALATFALSVGYEDSTLVIGPNAKIPTELSPSHATAVALDNYHLLTVAHNLEFDTGIRNWPVTNLKYKYAALIYAPKLLEFSHGMIIRTSLIDFECKKKVRQRTSVFQ